MKPPFTFAERLADLMTMTGLSNSTVARICGIDKSNVTHYLKGDYEAKQDVIFKLAARCQVSPVWLMGYNVPIREEYNPYLHKDEVASSNLAISSTRKSPKFLDFSRFFGFSYVQNSEAKISKNIHILT